MLAKLIKEALIVALPCVHTYVRSCLHRNSGICSVYDDADEQPFLRSKYWRLLNDKFSDAGNRGTSKQYWYLSSLFTIHILLYNIAIYNFKCCTMGKQKIVLFLVWKFVTVKEIYWYSIKRDIDDALKLI